MTASLKCPTCGRVTYNPNDIAEGYCGFCHEWTTNAWPKTREGGYIVAATEDFVIDVQPQIYNWRVHVALAGLYGVCYERGYCYQGTSLRTLLVALKAAAEWAKGDPFTTDPPGFYKRAF